MKLFKEYISALLVWTASSSAFCTSHQLPQTQQLFFAAIKSRGGGDDDVSNGNGEDSSSSSTAAAAMDDAAAPPSSTSNKLETLLAQAQRYLLDKNPDGAFTTLAQAYNIDPTSPKLSAMFESCLGVKVELAEQRYYSWKDSLSGSVGNDEFSEQELNDLFQDRMGLSSLFIDREHYDEAGVQLRGAIEEATFWLNYHLGQTNGEELSSSTTAIDFSSTKFHQWQPQLDRAQYLLYRTNAACCHWDTYFEDGDRLRQSLLSHGGMSSSTTTRLLHPFDALKFPCISLELASNIAQSYACRALETVDVDDPSVLSWQATNKERKTVIADYRQYDRNNIPPKQQRKIRIGYISPDFTSRHPLAFLMQHVFRYHDKSKFVVKIFSVSKDNGSEVRAIRESCDQFTYLSPSTMSPMDMYQRMVYDDELDIVVDLCGYAGTSVVSEIMASRCRLLQDLDIEGGNENKRRIQQQRKRFPLHVSYMGFPGSVGSSRIWDYSVFDPIVIPPDEKFGIRKHYSEAIVYMPHCYFVNSHKSVVGGPGDGIMLTNADERTALRIKYGIHPSAFVYCCHSRPDKIDPATFKSWMRALMRVRSQRKVVDETSGDSVPPVLWLLRSGNEMEQNLRRLVRQEFGDEAESSLVFADVAERNEHLRRLGIADVFLDTPAYNAHTLGCDALYMGVPMITLLHDLDKNVNNSKSADVDFTAKSPNNNKQHEMRSIATQKLASRVGASLLKAVGLDDLIFPNMEQYEDAIVRCAVDREWYCDLCQRLTSVKESSPLFDTELWVKHLEAALYKMIELGLDGDCVHDIVVAR